MRTMKAAVLHGKDELRIEDRPTPRPKAGEVLVRVKATGICGSDLPRVFGDAAHHYPIVLGHEFAGIVEDVGPEVTKVKPGDRVAGVPLKPCFRCADCRSGLYAQCRHYSFIGSREDASWAEYVVIPEQNALPVDDGISYEEAALVEPASVALHALQLIGFQGGEQVAILGGGNIGLLALQWVKILGARDVTVFDLDEKRLETARLLGADHTINASCEDADDRWKEITGGRGYGIVLETAGAVETMRQSFDVAANRARVCFIGTPVQPLSFEPKLFELINRKEFMLRGSWMSYSAPFPGREWEMTLHVLRQGRLNVRDIVFRKFPLERIREAFDLYRVPNMVKGKVILLND